MNVLTAVKKAGYKVANFAKAKEPQLWMIGGGIAVVAGTVFACKAALKIEDIVYYRNCVLDDIEADYEESDQTEEDMKTLRKEKAKAHAAAIGETVKNFAPAVGLDILGAVCFCRAYKVMDDRTAKAVAAYVALDQMFNDYRDRVRKDEGNDADNRYFTGEETPSSVVKVDDNDVPPEKFADSMFTFHFNPMTSPLYSPWDTGAETCHENVALFRRTKEQMDSKLDIRGHLFVNEILDELCMARTAPGALCGWVSHAFPTEGDGEVFFNIHDEMKYFPDAPQGPGWYRDYTFTLNPDPGVIWNKVIG